MRVTRFLLSLMLCGLLLACSSPVVQPTRAPTPLPTEQAVAPETVASPPPPPPSFTPTPLPTPTAERSYAGTEAAPDFPPTLDWLNTDRPLALGQLRGKVVLLDFWTYGCINCIHIIPDLKRLEAKYADELVVIGVHSAKFANEGETDNIRQIILRYGLEHPVVNDRDFEVWRTYGVEAWPTLILIDPAGNIVGRQSGEGIYSPLDRLIGALVAEFDAKGAIDRRALGLKLEKEGLPQTVLSFPGKVLVDSAGERLFIADSNHHRIVVADAASGAVQQVIGAGQAGLVDGDFGAARFFQPQGMALDEANEWLYVADTENHAIRRVDLKGGRVQTIAGTGEQTRQYPGTSGPGPLTALNSPWDLELVGETLFIAMAGSHQLWRMELAKGIVAPHAGSGREALTDGALTEGALNQPSGITSDGSHLYIADAEASAIRWADMGADGQLGTIVGTGLFDFGDADGVGDAVRLQHPLGVVYHAGLLYVADTYNNKIKLVEPTTRRAMTVVGGGAGWRDGSEPLFYEPGGLDIAGDMLYVADTNNHSIRVVELASRNTRTLTLTGIERFMAGAEAEEFVGQRVVLGAATVAAGPGQVELNVTVPEGYKINELAPYSMVWQVAGEAVTLEPDASRSIVHPTFPLTLDATFREGRATLTGELAIFYCEAVRESICLIQQVQLSLPVEVGAQGGRTLRLDYAIPPPDIDW